METKNIVKSATKVASDKKATVVEEVKAIRQIMMSEDGTSRVHKMNINTKNAYLKDVKFDNSEKFSKSTKSVFNIKSNKSFARLVSELKVVKGEHKTVAKLDLKANKVRSNVSYFIAEISGSQYLVSAKSGYALIQ